MAKKADFTPADAELLRAFARELQQTKGLTGDELGAIMGIAQQNASAKIKPGAVGGFGRITANSLARSEGFRDAEELLSFLKARSSIAEENLGNVWHARDTARKVAEAIGVAPEAISAVVALRRSQTDARRPTWWWLHQFTQQQFEVVADRESRK